MTKRGEVLVAIINNLNDFADLRDRHWYRIPVTSADRWLKDRFPPEWIAFYQTKKFGAEAYAVNYVAKVKEVRQVYRYEIFPDEPIGEKQIIVTIKFSYLNYSHCQNQFLATDIEELFLYLRLWTNSRLQNKSTTFMMTVHWKMHFGLSLELLKFQQSAKSLLKLMGESMH